MALTPSTFILESSSSAPDFTLEDPGGDSYSLQDCARNNGLLVVFWCNHCPFVIHLKKHFSEYSQSLLDREIGVVAIMSNDIENYPADAPSKMLEDIQEFAYPFPYLIDKDQSVAKAYRAACTPDFFLFDSDLKLFYSGQYDSSRPGNEVVVTAQDLEEAVSKMLASKGPIVNPFPSSGCNIKWIEGQEPEYFG